MRMMYVHSRAISPGNSKVDTMIQSVNFNDFKDAFRVFNRQATFSRQGLETLFDYLEEIDPDYDLDVVALCCDYSEDTIAQVAENYGLELPADETQEQHADAVRAYLMDHTSVVAEFDGKFLYAQF
tara:strand:+ start:228 stop:605 length:378 start_codon:yes stop_codon:yes gene_type:complete